MNPRRIVIYLAIVIAVGYGIFVSAILLEGDGCIINCYEGEYKDGKWHGIGTYTFTDGGRYEGEFKDGMKDGIGTVTWPNGEKYEGEFKDGNYHGRGEYVFSDGSKYEGEFRDGNVWNGIRTNADGSKTEWKDGEII